MNCYLVSFIVAIPLLVALIFPMIYIFKDIINEFSGEYDDEEN